MMKSLAFNAIILYILFKSSVRDLLMLSLPSLHKSLTTFPQLREALFGFLHKTCRLSRRSIACLLFVVGFWAVQKVWQRLAKRGQWVARFVERYLCSAKSRKPCSFEVVDGGNDKYRGLLF
jgi:hypothetical protein